MKTFRILGLTLFVILLCLSACSGGGDEPIEPTPTPEVVKSEITIDSSIIANGLTFTSEGGEKFISFTTNESWTLSVANTTSGTTWCTVSETNGTKGSASVKFTIAENTDYDNRSVSVTIKSGTATKTFTISQKGDDALLITKNKYEIGQEGGQIEIEVKTNIDYQMEISEVAKNWIKESSSRVLTAYKHTLSIAVNEETEKREGEIYFKSGDKVEIVKVYQASGPILLLSQNEYNVSDKGDTISVDIKSNIEYGVQMPDVDWIVDVASSRGLSSHTLKYVIKANEEYDNRSTNIIFFDKNSNLKDTLSIYQQGAAFETDYIDMKFDVPDVTTYYNATDGSLKLTYPSGNIPNVKVGNTIVLPAEYGFDIRVIESVSTSGNTLNLATSQGNMANLFRNISFTLTTDPSLSSRSVSGDNVYTPTSYGYLDENGIYHEIYNKDNNTRASLSIAQDLWNFKENFNDEVICSGKAGTLSWDKCEFNAGLKGMFTFDFGEKEIDKVRTIGELKKFGYKLTGNVDIDMLLHYEYEYKYEEQEDEIIKENVIPTKYFKFMVGNVPVVILVDTHLGKFTEFLIEGVLDDDDEKSKILDATAGVKLGTEVSVGLEWTPGGGVTPTKEIKPFFELYPFTIKAKAHAEAKVSYYPQIVVGIYKFLGPWLEPRSYLKETVDAGFNYSDKGDDNYIGWKAETYNGMDLRMGLNLDFGVWDKEIWTSDIYNCVKDRLLFEAPSRIRILSPDNNIKVEKGDSVKVELIVESFSPLTSQYYPCPLALVNISSERGELDKKVAITDVEGKVSLNWIPNPKNDETVSSRATSFGQYKLLAKVVDKDGKSIDESTLNVKSDDEVYELLELIYKQTNGDKWKNNENWLTDAPIEEWYGVTINPETGKLRLELGSNGLRGYIDLSELDRNTNSEYDWIEYLDCSYASLHTLNLSNSKSLKTLNCLHANDHFVSSNLDVSGCVNLDELIFGSGPYNNIVDLDFFETLNFSGCISLKEFDLSEHSGFMKSINFSNCTSLEKLELFAKGLSDLNVTGCTSLKDLGCFGSKITNLDVKSCSSLELLWITGDNQELDASGLSSLETIEYCTFKKVNISGCVNLKRIRQINAEEIDFSNCSSLEGIYIPNRNIQKISVKGCASLRELDCCYNQLTCLDVSELTKLERIECEHNKIEDLNVSGCTNLKYLRCEDNKITSIIPEWFSQLEYFHYDHRYTYGTVTSKDGVIIDFEYKDNGIGWWYPGEPDPLKN